jgi:nicotinate phosphoribosyltransferase
MSHQPGAASTFTLGDDDLSFSTDLYELTMAAAYHRLPTMPRATFELFVRRLPANRNFLVFAGLEQALASLVRMRFTDDQIEHLKSLPGFQISSTCFGASAFRATSGPWPRGRYSSPVSRSYG